MSPNIRNLSMCISALLIAMSLAACGGGGENQTHASPDGGRIFPAVTGVRVAEYDASGDLLQISQPSDAAGYFKFNQRTTGNRVKALRVQKAWAVNAPLSARFNTSQDAIEISPLTTAVDTFQLTGLKPVDANISIASALQATQTNAQPLAAASAPDGSNITPQAAQQIISSTSAQALSVYIEGLAAIGVGEDAPPAYWRDVFFRHADILRKMTEAANTVTADAWANSTSQAAAIVLGGTPINFANEVKSLREDAIRYTLEKFKIQILKSEFPEIAQSNQFVDVIEQLGAQAVATSYAVQRLSHGIEMIPVKTAPPGVVDQTFGLDVVNDITVSTTKVSVEKIKMPFNSFKITNLADKPRLFALHIDDSIFNQTSEIIIAAAALPQSEDTPFPIKLWKFFATQTTHDWPISGGRFLHQPTIFLNSVGKGICDDRAAAMARTWQWLGFSARVWSLEGHVAPEFLIDGRWQLLDPDMGVTYFKRDGSIASVSDIEAAPDLISNPVRRVPEAAWYAYSSTVADIYSSTNDNFVATWFDQPAPASLPAEWQLPPQSTLTIEPGKALQFQTIDTTATVDLPRVLLSLPPGFTGTIALPLLVSKISGTGMVRLSGSGKYSSTTTATETLLSLYRSSLPDDAYTFLDVNNTGTDALEVEFLLTPMRHEDTHARIEIAAAAASGLEISIQ